MDRCLTLMFCWLMSMLGCWSNNSTASFLSLKIENIKALLPFYNNEIKIQWSDPHLLTSSCLFTFTVSDITGEVKMYLTNSDTSS